MKSKQLIYIIILALSLQSCATYSISTIRHEAVQEDDINFNQDYRYQPHSFKHYSWYQDSYSCNHCGYYNSHTSSWLGNAYGNYNYGYTYHRRVYRDVPPLPIQF
jgi:hypothetical protein